MHLPRKIALVIAVALLPALACGKKNTAPPASPPVAGKIWHVPTETPTIAAALDGALAGDTIEVAPGSYHEHDLPMKEGVVLRSSTGQAERDTIQADTLGRVLTCTGNLSPATQIIGFTITGGKAFYGGGIWCDGSSPTIVNCVITGNTEVSDLPGGGGIYCYRSNPKLDHCTIAGNSARAGGGGIGCAASSPSLIDCTIADNRAPKGAGLSCIASSSPSLATCTISGNVASGGSGAGLGGGAYAHDSSPAFNDCTFTGNSATVSGGAIYCEVSSPILLGCTLSDNLAETQGGAALACRSSSPSLTDCRFLSNRAAAAAGGGLLCYRSVASLTGCEFADNQALVGGAVACSLASVTKPDTCTFRSCTFRLNTATERGGACYTFGSGPLFTGCAFDSNSTTGAGGGVACDSSALGDTCTFHSSTFRANIATSRGGALDCRLHAFPTSNSCTFYGNAARDGAAAGVDSSSIPRFRQCILAFGGAGGAVSLDADSVSFVCCDLYGNFGGDWTGKIEGQLQLYNNISADPLFCNAATSLAISPNSPCGSDSSSCGLMGAGPESCGGSADAVRWSFTRMLFGSGRAGRFAGPLARSWAQRR